MAKAKWDSKDFVTVESEAIESGGIVSPYSGEEIENDYWEDDM